MSRCTVCPQVIKHGLLMCSTHWRLVPVDVQKAVYAAHTAIGGSGVRNPAEFADALRAYAKARDAAETAARAAIKRQAHADEVLQDLQRITTHHQPQGLLL